MSFTNQTLGALGTVAGVATGLKHLKNQEIANDAANYEIAPKKAEQLNKEFSDLQSQEQAGIEQEAQLGANLVKSNEELKKMEESVNAYNSQFTDLSTPEGKLLDALGMAKKPTGGQKSWMTKQSKKLLAMQTANASLYDEVNSIVESNKQIANQRDLLMGRIEKAQKGNKYLNDYLSTNIKNEQMYGKGGKK